MTVPSALLSHESTEHYTPQYILDAVIACMGAIDLDPASNSHEIPNVPAARHYTVSGQRTRAALGGAGVSQSPVRARCRAVVLEVIPGAGRRPDHGGDCAVEVGDRDRGMEDTDGVVVPGVLPFSPHSVCGACRRWWSRADIFTGAVLCWGWAGAVRTSVCQDWGGVGGAGERVVLKRNICEKSIQHKFHCFS